MMYDSLNIDRPKSKDWILKSNMISLKNLIILDLYFLTHN